jgi:zeaxanthin glucosyltransferase
LQNAARDIFRTIAQACAGLDAQLVISLGGGLDPDALGSLPGDPLVVRYAPQLEIVKRAAAVITHAGLNTMLESLAEGVPLICIPLGNDQPGVAARVAAHEAGIVVPRRKLTVERLRSAIVAVLSNETYRAAARRLQIAMQQFDGLGAGIEDHRAGAEDRHSNRRLVAMTSTGHPKFRGIVLK